ncbi:MAG TPA: type II CRISPR RNA-guided endonuclease Cas9 [Candidatus Aquilonibacter sp.]|nr:type II CRISPR RNA-guided endonuclease Cas9 [Candidatus Aquilonibacter sp.]
MPDERMRDYVLGIDLGTSSVGWAMIALIDGEPHHLIRAGVRVFEAGMEGDLASGREESRNLKRRQMRLQRRQTWRRARRLRKIFNLLQSYGLLPQGVVSSPQERQEFLNQVDEGIRESAWFRDRASSGVHPEPQHVMPYILRAAALDEGLEPHFLGRALYHLAQRRGFWSNRKQVSSRKDKDDDPGVVEEGIAALSVEMQKGAARALGEYFSRLAPSEERIRARWTARGMFEKEFDAVWAAQARHHPDILTEARRKRLRHAFFFQRPLWFDRNTIGRCDLERGKRRIPAYLLAAQRFRLLQAVNNLTVSPPGGAEWPLAPSDRQRLVDELEAKGDLKYDRVRKLLGLRKDYEFNLERGGEKTIRGNRTNAKLLEAFGDRWLVMTPAERDAAVEYVHSFQNPAKLESAAGKYFGLSPEACEKLAAISLEPDYMGHSRTAIERLLPLLEQGIAYSEARKIAYPGAFQAGQAADLLPPVERAMTGIRNPAVMRSLTEMRKVVNAILQQYGKPAQIRIELARDLKKSKKQREAISESHRRNEKSRSAAAEEIIKAQVGIKEPRPDDIRKYLLAIECGWQCPYTEKRITPRTLFGPEAQFDIEHIIPFSRSMDNSFQNLTLCHLAENRNVKGNNTPHQAYSGDSERYERMIERVKQFAGEKRTVAAKLRRFLMNDDELESFLEDFRNRQLNDTAYATSLAAHYLGLLYGGLVDANGARRVQATSGGATHDFRNLWKLNSILGDGETANGGYLRKSRTDHRHHAIDAVVIGLTSAAMIQRLTDAAQRAPSEHRRRFASLEAPWHNFVDSVRAEINRIVVSHRVSKKVSGALHEETIYSPPEKTGKPRTRRVIDPSRPGKRLSKSEVDQIADAAVRGAVVERLRALSADDPQKAFMEPRNIPFLPNKNGNPIPIRSVRVDIPDRVFAVGNKACPRFVATESNHHVEVAITRGVRGRESWEGRVVSRKDAYERVKALLPVVDRAAEADGAFLFSVGPGEILECRRNGSGVERLVFKGASQYSAGPVVISLLPINDARKSPRLVRIVPNKLRDWGARKIVVGPLGDVSEAHD